MAAADGVHKTYGAPAGVVGTDEGGGRLRAHALVPHDVSSVTLARPARECGTSTHSRDLR